MRNLITKPGDVLLVTRYHRALWAVAVDTSTMPYVQFVSEVPKHIWRECYNTKPYPILDPGSFSRPPESEWPDEVYAFLAKRALLS